jgi:E3 ubiquitin-protein ligase HUWE1
MPDDPYPPELVDALFSLISYIVSTQTGGNMVITAGLLSCLLQLVSSTQPNQLKVRRDNLAFSFMYLICVGRM